MQVILKLKQRMKCAIDWKKGRYLRLHNRRPVETMFINYQEP